MNRFVVLALVALCSSVAAAAGKSTAPCPDPKGFDDSLYATLPEIPANLCGSTADQKVAYFSAVDRVHQRVLAELDRREAASEAAAERGNAQAKGDVAKMAGVSQKDVERLENASDEETDAFVDKLLEKQAGLTMADAEKMANMSESAQNAYAASLAAEQQGAAAGNQKQIGAQDARAKGSVALARRQQDLLRKLQSGRDKLAADRKKLKDDPGLRALSDKVAKLSGYAIDDSRRAGLDQARGEYCAAAAPKYVGFVRSFDTWVLSSRADHCELDRVSNDLYRTAQGTSEQHVQEGTSWLKDFAEAASLRRGVFAADLRPQEQPVER